MNTGVLSTHAYLNTISNYLFDQLTHGQNLSCQIISDLQNNLELQFCQYRKLNTWKLSFYKNLPSQILDRLLLGTLLNMQTR